MGILDYIRRWLFGTGRRTLITFSMRKYPKDPDSAITYEIVYEDGYIKATNKMNSKSIWKIVNRIAEENLKGNLKGSKLDKAIVHSIYLLHVELKKLFTTSASYRTKKATIIYNNQHYKKE